jgi:hypothetical protein
MRIAIVLGILLVGVTVALWGQRQEALVQGHSNTAKEACLVNLRLVDAAKAAWAEETNTGNTSPFSNSADLR